MTPSLRFGGIDLVQTLKITSKNFIADASL